MYVRSFFFFFTNLHVFNHQLNSFAFYAPCSVRFDCLHILLGKAWSSGLLVLARLLQIPPLLWRIRFYNVRRDKLSSTSASTFVRKNEACSLHKFRRTFDVFLRTLELYVPQVTEVGIYPEEENLCTVTQSLSSFKDCRYDVYAGDIGLLQSCSAACTVPRSLSSFFFFFFFFGFFQTVIVSSVSRAMFYPASTQVLEGLYCELLFEVDPFDGSFNECGGGPGSHPEFRLKN